MRWNGRKTPLEAFAVNTCESITLNKVNNFRAVFYMLDAELDRRFCYTLGTNLFYTGSDYNFNTTMDELFMCQKKNIGNAFAFTSRTGDIFPNEYRPTHRIDSSIMWVPEEFILVNTPKVDSDGDVVVEVIYHENPDGSITFLPGPDYRPHNWRNTFNPKIKSKWTTTCSTPTGIYTGKTIYHKTLYNYLHDADKHVQVMETDAHLPEIIYTAPDVQTVVINQVQSGINGTVEWEVQTCNYSSEMDIETNWLEFDNTQNPDITIEQVLDITSGAAVAIPFNDIGSGKTIVPINTLFGGSCATHIIRASYSLCEEKDLLIRHGWGCNDHPSVIEEIGNCSEFTFGRVTPQPAQLSATIATLAETPADPMNPSAGLFGSDTLIMCEPFPVEFRIISAGATSLFDINFDILIPNLGLGIEYVPGSATIEVEGIDLPDTPRPVATTGENAFANAIGTAWNIQLADLDPTNFGSGQPLLGAGTNPYQNEIIIRWLMQTTCDFTSGESLSIRSFADAHCNGITLGSGETVRSSDLDIKGIVQPYAVLMDGVLTPDNIFVGCEDTKTLEIDMTIAGGVTGLNDSLIITLGSGLYYAGGNYCLSSDCPTFVGTQTVDGAEQVMYQYPAGITETQMDFGFDVKTMNDMSCFGKDINLHSKAQTGGIACGVNVCQSTDISTGFSIVGYSVEKPNFSLIMEDLGFEHATNTYNYSINVSNYGAATEGDVIVDLYCLNELTGEIDLSYPYVISHTIPGPIAQNETVSITDAVIDPQCGLSMGFGAVIRSTSESGFENCFCLHEDDRLLNLFPSDDVFYELPVELTRFELREEACNVRLYWESASEIDFKEYEIEWSKDGMNFNTLAVIPGTGGLTHETYNYLDREPEADKLYYRLKMVDLDGSYEYSVIRNIAMDCSGLVKAFPNPIESGKKLILEFPHISVTRHVETIILTDMLGRTIKNIEQPEISNSRILVNTDYLNPGSHLLEIRYENGDRQTLKILLFNK